MNMFREHTLICKEQLLGIGDILVHPKMLAFDFGYVLQTHNQSQIVSNWTARFLVWTD